MTDQTTQAAEPQAVQLQLQDLALAAQVIQLVSARGAIKPEEMKEVGGLYERLVAFLQQSGALQPADQAQAPAAPAAPTDAATAAAVAQ
jgi:hypothetical protein